MKKRLISAVSVACIGCMVFTFCYRTDSSKMKGLTAGIVSSAVVNVDEVAAVSYTHLQIEKALM